MILIAGTMQIKADKLEGAKAAMATMMEATAAEPGNLAYFFSQSLGDANLVHIFEKWESEEALNEHMGSEHMAAFMGALAEAIESAEVKKYEGASESNLM